MTHILLKLRPLGGLGFQIGSMVESENPYK